MPADSLIPPEILQLSAYQPADGQCSVRLDANEISHPLPADMAGEVRNALARVELNRYPDPDSRKLRGMFAETFGCRPENVMVGNGSDELIALLLATFRNGPGGRSPGMLVPVPTFAMYSICARAAGYVVNGVPLRDDLTLDQEVFCRKIEESAPNIVFLASPNNPTGTLFPAEVIDAVVRTSRGLVVLDEAYGDYASVSTWIGMIDEHPNLAVLRTLSKIGGAALRCGFLVAGKRLLDQVQKTRMPFNVSSMTQAAGEIFLARYGVLADRARIVASARDRLASDLRGLSMDVFPSEANFVLLRAKGREGDLFRFLREAGIMVKFLPALEVVGDALRITVGTVEENSALLERIRQFCLTEGER